MKRFIILFALLGLGSCHFLEVENVGKSDISGFFSESSSAETAMYGVYHELYGLYDKYLLTYAEVTSDELVLSPSNSEWLPFQDFTLTSSDESNALGMIWKGAYGIISNCNEIIHYAPSLAEKFPSEQASIKSYLAQAYFVRALMHLELCLVYGQNYTYTDDASHLGVVIVNHIPGLTETMARSSVAKVYAQIIEDLETALKTFPTELTYSSRYFASPNACKALLARVYLYMNDWDAAVRLSNEVISSTKLVSSDAYKSMFCSRTPSEDESIFRINGQLLGSTSYKFYYWENPQARPSDKVRKLLEQNNDIRAGLLDYSEQYPDIVMKYTCTDDVASEEDRYYSPVVLRASEMYLIRAEALLEKQDKEGAAADIKTIRSRATGIPVSQIRLSDDLDKEIEEERIRELCFEGHRFFDITRRHRNLERGSDTYSKVRTLKYPDYRMVLPIPAVELEANKAMVNNPDHNEN